MVVAADGTVVHWSSEAAALFARPDTDAVGRSAIEVTAAFSMELLITPLVEADRLMWRVDLAGGATQALTLQALFSQPVLGLHILDADLRLKRLNPATAAMRQREVGELIGLPLRDAYPLADPDEVEALARGTLTHGRPVLEHRVRAFIDPDPAPARTYSVSMFRLASSAGILGLAVIVVDVTEQAVAEEGTRVLAAVREQAGTSLDAVHICQELAEALTTGLADIAVVEIVDALRTGADPPLFPPPAVVSLHGAATSTRISGSSRGPLGSTHEPVPNSPFALALTQGRPVAVTLEERDSAWFHAAGDHTAVQGARPHALLIAPLMLRGRLLGLLSLYRLEGSPGFTTADADLSASVADYAALCLENSRQYTGEHAVAATVQQRFLPQVAETAVGMELAHGRLPTRAASGGWYDVISLPSARTALVIGEVAGVGAYTSAAMGQLRTALRALASLDLEPDELLARLDDTTRQLAAERRALPAADPLRAEPLTVSCACALYDPVSGSLAVARAGHPGPILISADGSLVVVDLPNGPRLGSSDTAPFAAGRVEVLPGAMLALATPGLLGPLGPRGVRDHLVGVATPLHELCDKLLLTASSTDPAGDVILLLGKAQGLAQDVAVDWVLEADEHAPAAARQHVREQLQHWGLPEEATYTTELLVSEVVTNAVRYGEPPCRLRLIRAEQLTVEVRDGATSSPHVRHARTTDEGGRGLYIVAALSDRWGVRTTTRGKTVWFEQPLEGTATHA
ncbi:SpoIIE family protein phosphatase [Streptomyces sp. NPDC005548]|uniref:ATP-binding SpoIIE family protein phosphatase n=1 Tax=Streptomyces sp. NPDC005548 TaxID=3364724 RepID=UPI0036938938